MPTSIIIPSPGAITYAQQAVFIAALGMLVGVAIIAAATAMMFLMIWQKNRKRQAARKRARFTDWQ